MILKFNDLRDMPLGAQHFAAIPFHIIDPATNDGKACIVSAMKKAKFDE